MPRGVFDDSGSRRGWPFKSQLLKWVGNKQRFAHHIVAYFPSRYGTYYEALYWKRRVLATLAPLHAVGSDVFKPLAEIWQTLHRSPETLTRWYAERRAILMSGEKVDQYEKIKASYNAAPQSGRPALPLPVLLRRCGPLSQVRRLHVDTLWRPHPHPRREVRGSSPGMVSQDRRDDVSGGRLRGGHESRPGGDLIYCDPPYADTQTIPYGAQTFRLARLFRVIGECKERGVKAALSLDGTKRSGEKIRDLTIPPGLFEQEIQVNCGRSMLRRFQMGGQSLEGEVVADRLLLTYSFKR